MVMSVGDWLAIGSVVAALLIAVVGVMRYLQDRRSRPITDLAATVTLIKEMNGTLNEQGEQIEDNRKASEVNRRASLTLTAQNVAQAGMMTLLQEQIDTLTNSAGLNTGLAQTQLGLTTSQTDLQGASFDELSALLIKRNVDGDIAELVAEMFAVNRDMARGLGATASYIETMAAVAAKLQVKQTVNIPVEEVVVSVPESLPNKDRRGQRKGIDTTDRDKGEIHHA